MSVAYDHLTHAEICPLPLGPAPSKTRRMHRLQSVRLAEGISRRTMARRLHTDVETVAREEDESADLSLSTLYRWQAALDVPLAELLVDPGAELSPPVLERSQMVRLMKTAMSIIEQAKQTRVRRMAQNLINQVLEIMPELQGVGGWPSVGQRRSLKDLGQAAQRFFSGGSFAGPDE
jgi:transcriptional regulator with XRE-family HTH domain